jgi:hypothetical protein
MPNLTCGRCGLTIADETVDGTQECPRCLARSSGALTIPMVPSDDDRHRRPQRPPGVRRRVVANDGRRGRTR